MDISVEVAIVKSFEEGIFRYSRFVRCPGNRQRASEGYDAQTNSAFKIV